MGEIISQTVPAKFANTRKRTPQRDTPRPAEFMKARSGKGVFRSLVPPLSGCRIEACCLESEEEDARTPPHLRVLRLGALGLTGAMLNESDICMRDVEQVGQSSSVPHGRNEDE